MYYTVYWKIGYTMYWRQHYEVILEVGYHLDLILHLLCLHTA